MGLPPTPRSWSLAALLADLEQQAMGQAHLDRDEEVAALAEAGHADLDLLARLHGAHLAAGAAAPVLEVRLVAGEALQGRLARVGADFLVLEVDGPPAQWVVPLFAIALLSGVGDRVLLPDARPLTARLGIGSVLRGLAEQGTDVRLLLASGAQVPARVVRVGADFVEILDHDRERAALVPLTGLAALRLR